MLGTKRDFDAVCPHTLRALRSNGSNTIDIGRLVLRVFRALNGTDHIQAIKNVRRVVLLKAALLYIGYMDDPDRPATQQDRNFAGVSSLIMGAGILALGAGLFPRYLDDLRTPLWVILAAGALFLLVGVSMLVQQRVAAWVSGLIANAIITLFAAIFAWIAWGEGLREFSGSGISLAWLLGFDGMSFGRIVFSMGAILSSTFALITWLLWLATFEWKALAGVVPALGLAGYALFVLVPAEPLWADVQNDHDRLARYAELSTKEGWAGYGGGAPASWRYPPWRNFERWTKAARDRLAAARIAPAGAEILSIPDTGISPDIDGRIGADEWRGALRIALAPESLGSSVQLTSDGKRLYVAAEVPRDTTEDGHDQLSFLYHIGLSPWLQSETVSIRHSNDVTGLRTIRVPQTSLPPKDRTDSHVTQLARGATRVAPHRQYELMIDLREAGIKPGVAFTAGFHIEGDPVVDDKGKFKASSTLGTTYRSGSLLWLRVDPQLR